MPRIARRSELLRSSVATSETDACLALFVAAGGCQIMPNQELEVLFALNTARRRAVEVNRRSLVVRIILLVLFLFGVLMQNMHAAQQPSSSPGHCSDPEPAGA
jgi:hypothetical protein